MFCYHGAEHKTIFCYEAGLPLTVENVRIQPRHHPRCGTSFLFVVIIVSIIVSSLVFPYINWQSVWVRVGVKLLLLVPVVGITYEFNRMVGAHDNALTRVLSAPGMWLQNFTTHEPDDSMIEVAHRGHEAGASRRRRVPTPGKPGLRGGAQNSGERRKIPKKVKTVRIMAITYNNLYLDVRQQLPARQDCPIPRWSPGSWYAAPPGRPGRR